MELAQLKEQVLLDPQFVIQIANQVALIIDNALTYAEIEELKEQLSKEKLYLEDEIRSEHGFEQIIGRSSAIRRCCEHRNVAPTDSTVLIYGETGTGKELSRSCHSRTEFSEFKSFCEAELCRNTYWPSRERTFWSRKRRLHGRFMHAGRSVRTREPWHRVPGRNRRDLPGAPA